MKIEALEELNAGTKEEFEESVFRILEEDDMIEDHRKTVSSSIESVPYTALEYEIELEGEKKVLSVLYHESSGHVEVEDYNIREKN